jgi:O-antigen/teichoic acid export membrane protein
MLALFYVIVTFSIALIIGYRGKQLYLLAFLGFNQFLISFIFYLRSNVSGLLLFRTDSFLSVLDRIIMIIICAALIWGNIFKQPFRIEWFIYAQTLGYSLTALIALSIVMRKAAFKRLTWNWTFFIMIIKKSFPFALLVLLMTFYNRIDSVLIERLLQGGRGDEQATVYASAFRLLDATNMIAFLFSVLLLPIFSRMIKNKESIEQMLKLAFTLLITISIIIAFASFFYSFEIMDLLYVAHIDESANVFRILMFGYVSICSIYIFGSLLTANGNLLQLNIIAASSMIISIGLNIILIPRFEAVGSAWASIITQFLSASAHIIVAVILFKLRMNYRFIGSLLVFIAGVILINILTRKLEFAWEINFLIMIVSTLILATLLRLLNFRALLAIIRNR